MEQMKNAEKLEFLLDTYGNSLFRLSLMMLQNEADAEDALQDTFIRYLQKAPSFRDDAHEKAWLFRVCTNLCHDRIRCRKRHPHLDLEAQHSLAAKEADTALLEALGELPEKYRLVLLLHYVEGYRIREIAEMIGRTPSAVKMRLKKGRSLLEDAYGKEEL